MNFFNGLLSRAPFTILGMMGLFSIVGNFMTLEENIYQTLEAWRSVTRPIWDFLLGWLFEWIGWEMPWWVKDYLTMGVITTAAAARADIGETTAQLSHFMYVPRNLQNPTLQMIVWPHFIYKVTLNLRHLNRYNNEFMEPDDDPVSLPGFIRAINRRSQIFAECYVYALFLIALNFVFVISGAPSVPPLVQIWV